MPGFREYATPAEVRERQHRRQAEREAEARKVQRSWDRMVAQTRTAKGWDA